MTTSPPGACSPPAPGTPAAGTPRPAAGQAPPAGDREESPAGGSQGVVHVRKARRGSRCALCGAPVTVGQQITDGDPQGWSHVECMISERNGRMSAANIPGMPDNDRYSYGEVGHDPPVHVVAGPWRGPAQVSRKENILNTSLCGRPLSRRRQRRPEIHDLCRKCEELMDITSASGPGVPADTQDYQIQVVRLGDLFVDRDDPPIQRAEQPAWVKKIAASFDWNRFNENPPKVAARPGGRYHVMDGQHEVAAARKAGHGPETKVRVLVWHGLTRQEQAEKFSHNRDRHAVRALDLFKADVTRDEPLPAAVADILGRHGWQADSSGVDGNLAAVTTLLRIAARRNGLRAADKVMETVTAAWGLSHQGVHTLIIKALGAFYAAYPDADPRRLAERLSRVTPETVQAWAKSDHDPVGRLKGTYNSGLRNPDRRLT